MVTSDSRGSESLPSVGKAVPGQIVEVGIAEQNLVGVASGLAAAGKTRVCGFAGLLSDCAVTRTDQE